jgi:sugar diacid utilization regulator
VGGADAALLCLRPLSALTGVERDALDQVARYLSLEVARQQAVQAIEQRFASELLDMILSGPQRAGEVPERLRAFGVDPDGPLAVCAVAFAEEPATVPGLAEAVAEFFLVDNVAAVVAAGSQDVVAVLPWRRDLDTLTSTASRLARAVGGRFGGRRVVVGLAEPGARAADLRQPLVRSRDACRVLRSRRGGPVVATFAELGTYRLLFELQDGERMRGFADSVLGPIRAQDRTRGSDLEATLRTFLDKDGQWAETAAALFVHVNTLRNRMARIAELTGRDVGRTVDRVDLFLALEVDAGQSG